MLCADSILLQEVGEDPADKRRLVITRLRRTRTMSILPE
jgi:hypothetical protein